ncbi:putative U2 small nuclear ribonucleoprotein B'' [Hypsibius exemplaris]|uniref:U2 small nuclear ribonucleoprotein B n=1 Tax=Hypsibius exemplaris TaxID=2072580 RepID=A0A1W0WJ90_HYPEX|nr:putative U2 small nuclear ribonucleoprotein B'' [Hypsibius exemplaris]
MRSEDGINGVNFEFRFGPPKFLRTPSPIELLLLYSAQQLSIVPFSASSLHENNMEAPPPLPNNTLYLNNLSDKLKRKRLQDSLRAVFKQFGDIIDILCWPKSLSRKGQAWVIFRETSSAIKALTSMQGFPFYDKPMRIQFARADSDLLAKQKGTFVPRPKKKPLDKVKKVKPVAAPIIVGGELRPAPINPESIPDNQPPHNILFVTNLPQEGGEEFLSQMFQQYQGFREVRMVPSRPDIAFVEYENEMFASMAKDGLQGFKVTPTQKIKVVFAKK